MGLLGDEKTSEGNESRAPATALLLDEDSPLTPQAPGVCWEGRDVSGNVGLLGDEKTQEGNESRALVTSLLLNEDAPLTPQGPDVCWEGGQKPRNGVEFFVASWTCEVVVCDMILEDSPSSPRDWDTSVFIMHI